MKIKRVEVVENPRRNARKANLVVCFRVMDLPKPHVMASSERCGECRMAIWVATTSPPNTKRVCRQCADDLLDGEDDVVIMISADAVKRAKG